MTVAMKRFNKPCKDMVERAKMREQREEQKQAA